MLLASVGLSSLDIRINASGNVEIDFRMAGINRCRLYKRLKSSERWLADPRSGTLSLLCCAPCPSESAPDVPVWKCRFGGDPGLLRLLMFTTPIASPSDEFDEEMESEEIVNNEKPKTKTLQKHENPCKTTSESTRLLMFIMKAIENQ